MTYPEVYDRAEALLIEMVVEGVATFEGVGASGTTFRVGRAAAIERMESAGLLADSVPWIHPLRALRALVVEAPELVTDC